MSQQQVQRLQTLLETVQRNRQRPGEPIGAAANVVAKAPANTTKAAAAPAEPARARVLTPDMAAASAAAAPARPAQPAKPAQAPAAQAPATQPRAGAPAQPPAIQTPGSQPKAGAPVPRAPEPQPAPPAPVPQEPIVPRTFEPEVPRAANRPIAQLVSKHAPVVDATFGAMLKRSLSLRPH
ncbi:MAG TPA: hypothetical protein VFN67_31590 [Polyangiales bacterium]|nr:hypothetical protein [Polyangiales bacterium]